MPCLDIIAWCLTLRSQLITLSCEWLSIILSAGYGTYLYALITVWSIYTKVQKLACNFVVILVNVFMHEQWLYDNIPMHITLDHQCSIPSH